MVLAVSITGGRMKLGNHVRRKGFFLDEEKDFFWKGKVCQFIWQRLTCVLLVLLLRQASLDSSG
jgi:hypothetical protein